MLQFSVEEVVFSRIQEQQPKQYEASTHTLERKILHCRDLELEYFFSCKEKMYHYIHYLELFLFISPIRSGILNCF
jgi:hypothetical protein